MTPVLDLGNVVIQVDWQPFCQYLAKHCSEESSPVQLLRFTRSSLFYEFEFGNIAPAEFHRRMAEMYKAHFSESDFFAAFCSIFPGWVPNMQEMLQQLDETEVGVYCLSNTNEVHLQYLQERFPTLAQFRKVFASHQIKRRKPYPGTYRQIARELQLAPKEIIFFDDLDTNVNGARRAGLEAHIFKDSNDFTSHYNVLEGIEK